MSTELNDLLPTELAERVQPWIIGTREQVIQMMNECYVRKLVSDRAQFTPLVTAPVAPGRWMVVVLVQ